MIAGDALDQIDLLEKKFGWRTIMAGMLSLACYFYKHQNRENFSRLNLATTR
jgi:hypothetical protein